MLRHDLISKRNIIQFLTFTVFVTVFFFPENTYAASFNDIMSTNINLFSGFLFSLTTIMAAVMISYILFIKNTKASISANKAADASEILQNAFSAFAQNTEESIIMVNQNKDIVYINPSAEKLLGYSKDEVLGKPLSALHDKAAIETAAAIELTHPDTRETSSLESNIDTLTGLPNRKLLFEHLDSIIINKKIQNPAYALMLINLDFFRSINNNLGYEVGDTILRECSGRLRGLFTEDSFLARMDGDEFALVVHISSVYDIEAAVNKIFEIMKEPIILYSQEIFISVSIGVSYFPEQGKNASEIIRNAASSVNMVKNTRRGSFKIFSNDISRYNYQKFNIHAELRQALERQEFILHYQPKIDGKTGHVVGIEALIRWNHPERGLLYPADFIPVAEETGIIKYIDEWVLYTACSQLKTWIDEGIDNIRLAVNLSAWQFKDQHLLDTVSKVLADTGINPRQLELEITETAAIENIDFTQNTLAKLIKMGVTISIDDFGTGYSSLTYLKDFPISFLKIDKSFVADILKDDNTYSIVKAIIEVAHALKLKVLAEGVENQEQLKLLNKLGCDEVQGYLFSKPLTVEDIDKKIHTTDT